VLFCRLARVLLGSGEEYQHETGEDSGDAGLGGWIGVLLEPVLGPR
jgi:hypothetical protein